LLVAFVVLELSLRIAIAFRTPPTERAIIDERERFIEMKSTELAFQVLVLAALAGMGMLHATTSTGSAPVRLKPDPTPRR
jgi:hypothetical protein